MSEHSIIIDWKRKTDNFEYSTYNRTHTIRYSPSGEICASSAPEFYGDQSCVNPEQAFVMAYASCHMLTFLALASKKGYTIDSYYDEAICELGKNPKNRSAVTAILLNPKVHISGDKMITTEIFESLHKQAHGACIIANSIADWITTSVKPELL
jgi:organic hydroperoxide reductase OsmC/OhrA